MKPVLSVFTKVFVKEFYRVNAGFFLIVVGMCFGFLSGVEHVALAQAFTSNYILLLIPIGLWFLYTLKVIAFNTLSLSRNENLFLFSSSGLSLRNLLPNLITVSTYQLSPVTGYGAFLMLIAYRNGQFTSIIEILLIIILLVSGVAIRLYRELLHPHHEINTGALRRKINSLLTKPFFWFFPEWLTRRQPLLVFGTKVLASLIIIAISTMYSFDPYDERFIEMGCAVAFSLNLVIVFYYHRFENFHFDLLRSMPIPLVKRLFYFLSTSVILLIPEIGTLIHYFPTEISLVHLFSSIAFGLSIILLAYAYLFMQDMLLEKFIQWVFVMTFTWIVLILFKIPLIALTAVHAIIAIRVYHRHYYRFEFNSAINSEK